MLVWRDVSDYRHKQRRENEATRAAKEGKGKRPRARRLLLRNNCMFSHFWRHAEHTEKMYKHEADDTNRLAISESKFFGLSDLHHMDHRVEH